MWSFLATFLVLGALSCETDADRQMAKDNERKKIIELLKRNGFVQISSRKARTGNNAYPSNVENKSFNTYLY